ncbi:unnamed protein product [Anisakis simplex]|uniref:Doublecortin domain-containing protein n=1 Tax=Anisakis simplex TaxID=6269 RepID=A0A0M3JZB0_ANISI|nr:unnamed protein product [Anisakis simplex]
MVELARDLDIAIRIFMHPSVVCVLVCMNIYKTTVNEALKKPISTSTNSDSGLIPSSTAIPNCLIGKRIRVYRNGDVFYNGLKVVINTKQINNIQTFLDVINERIGLTYGAKRLYTISGQLIKSLDQIENDKEYVAATNVFTPLNYGQSRSRLPFHHTNEITKLKLNSDSSTSSPSNQYTKQSLRVSRSNEPTGRKKDRRDLSKTRNASLAPPSVRNVISNAHQNDTNSNGALVNSKNKLIKRKLSPKTSAISNDNLTATTTNASILKPILSKQSSTPKTHHPDVDDSIARGVSSSNCQKTKKTKRKKIGTKKKEVDLADQLVHHKSSSSASQSTTTTTVTDALIGESETTNKDNQRQSSENIDNPNLVDNEDAPEQSEAAATAAAATTTTEQQSILPAPLIAKNFDSHEEERPKSHPEDSHPQQQQEKDHESVNTENSAHSQQTFDSDHHNDDNNTNNNNNNNNDNNNNSNSNNNNSNNHNDNNTEMVSKCESKQSPSSSEEEAEEERQEDAKEVEVEDTANSFHHQKNDNSNSNEDKNENEKVSTVERSDSQEESQEENDEQSQPINKPMMVTDGTVAAADHDEKLLKG